MRIVGKIKEDSKSNGKKEEPVKTTDGLIDVAKKYSLSGPILNQSRIDEIVKKYKNKLNKS